MARVGRSATGKKKNTADVKGIGLSDTFLMYT